MNTLAQRLNVDRLLLQAPMAGSQGSALALSVCAAGGIGALPAAMLSPEALTQNFAQADLTADQDLANFATADASDVVPALAAPDAAPEAATE